MQHTAEVSGWAVAGAIGMVVWMVVMWAGVAVLFVALRKPLRPWMFQAGLGVVGLGVLAQLGHFQEHVAQVVYWIGHSNEPGWMTPWGTALANGFGKVDHTKPALGMEILHLVGNFHFLAGLAGLALLTQHAVRSRARRWGRMGVLMQGIHGLEHIALTVSVLFGAKAIGLSTWFGLLDAGPGLWTYRVWWHFFANVIGTTIFALALYHLWRERATIAASYYATTDKAAPATTADEAVPALT